MLFVGLSFSYAEGFLSPVVQVVSVLKDIYRNLIVSHDRALVLFRKGAKGLHRSLFIIRAVGVVDFEIEDIVCNHCEKDVLLHHINDMTELIQAANQNIIKYAARLAKVLENQS